MPLYCSGNLISFMRRMWATQICDHSLATLGRSCLSGFKELGPLYSRIFCTGLGPLSPGSTYSAFPASWDVPWDFQGSISGNVVHVTCCPTRSTGRATDDMCFAKWNKSAVPAHPSTAALLHLAMSSSGLIWFLMFIHFAWHYLVWQMVNI